MLAKTHLAFAFLLGLLLLPYLKPSDKVLFFVFVLIGALIIDIDHPKSKLGRRFGFVSHIFKFLFGHRGLFHSIFFTLAASYFVYYFNNGYGAALFIGCMSHLIADGFTKQGINFLHPIAKLHISGFIETGNFLETILFLILLAVIFIRLVAFF